MRVLSIIILSYFIAGLLPFYALGELTSNEIAPPPQAPARQTTGFRSEVTCGEALNKNPIVASDPTLSFFPGTLVVPHIKKGNSKFFSFYLVLPSGAKSYILSDEHKGARGLISYPHRFSFWINDPDQMDHGYIVNYALSRSFYNHLPPNYDNNVRISIGPRYKADDGQRLLLDVRPFNPANVKNVDQDIMREKLETLFIESIQSIDRGQAEPSKETKHNFEKIVCACRDLPNVNKKLSEVRIKLKLDKTPFDCEAPLIGSL